MISTIVAFSDAGGNPGQRRPTDAVKATAALSNRTRETNQLKAAPTRAGTDNAETSTKNKSMADYHH